MLYELENEKWTLIELLAVIVILAVIALIATPFVLNIIERAEKGAFKDSVYGIMEATEFQVLLDESKYPITYLFPEDNERIKFKGTKPSEGYLQIVTEGKIKLAIGNGRWCAIKDSNESQVSIENGHCEKFDLGRPIISGYGDLIQEINVNDIYTMPDVTAIDKNGDKLNVTTTMKQGDKIVDSINTSKAGTYTITYTTEPDKEGNISSVTVTVKIIKEETDTDKVIEGGLQDGGLELIDDTYYYRGNSPKNWIQFNRELWRIISVENGKMKIIRETSIPSIPWNIQTFNSRFYDILSAEAKTQTEESNFYIGKVDASNGLENINAAMLREYEKMEEWTGNVGVMNASDFVYASLNSACLAKAIENNACDTDNWLSKNIHYFWTMQQTNAGKNNTLYIHSDGLLRCSSANVNSVHSRPVLFLKANIKIVSGEGSKENPFVVQ